MSDKKLLIILTQMMKKIEILEEENKIITKTLENILSKDM